MTTRIAKEGTIRKQELMEAAFLLFTQKGYEHTTVNAIIQAVGVSKGAFYYHFESKEEILNALVHRQVQLVLGIAREVADAKELSAVEKINLLIARVQAFRFKNRKRLFKLFEFYLNEENILYRYKLEEYTIKQALPIYVAIIRQGIAEKTFYTSNPELAAELVMRVAPILRMKMAMLYLDLKKYPENYEKIKSVAEYLEEAITKILGLKEGVLKITSSFLHFFTTTEEDQ
jgi:AcrR family transcriptional regulator